MSDVLPVVAALITLAIGFVGLPLLGLALVLWSVTTTLTLRRRVDRLETALAALKASPSIAAAPSTVEVPPAAHDAVPSGPSPQDAPEEPLSEEAPPEDVDGGEVSAPPPDDAPDPTRIPEPPAAPSPPPTLWPTPERILTWLAAGLGGATLVIAGLLALAVVIDRGWMGPGVRVSAALVGGSLAWVAGVAARRRLPVVGSAVAGAAIGTLYGALFAASGLYHLIAASTASTAMIAITVVATATAARDDDRFTAHLGLIGGLLTPVLVSSGENRPAALFGYLTLLLCGVLWAARRRGWWDVTAVALVGVASIHIGWSVRWYAADQVPLALLGLLALSLPFAWVGRDERPLLQLTGIGGALVLPLLALPWVVPVDPVFSDPRSGLQVVRPLGEAAWWAAFGVGALLLPAWLAGRRAYGAPVVAIASVIASLLMLVATAAWLGRAPDWPVALCVLAVAPLLVGTTALARSEGRGAFGPGLGLLPLPLTSGIALSALATIQPGAAAAPVAVSAAILVVAGLVAARTTQVGLLLLPTLMGASLALDVAVGGLPEGDRLPGLGPSLLALALLGVVPLLLRWQAPRVALGAAALTWPAMFPALHTLWLDAFGPSMVGALPLLLGAGALLGASTLMRLHRVDRSDPALALFVGVALLGVTASMPVQLEEGWLTVAWALQAAALGLLAHRLHHPLIRVFAVLLGLTVAVRLLLNPWALSYGEPGGWPVLNWTLYTWGVPFVALLVLARVLPRKGDLLDHAPAVLRVLALLVGFGLVDLQVTHAFSDATPAELGGHALWRGMVRSVAWAGYGLVVLLAGLQTDRRAVRFIGFSFILLATAKVFVVDLWALSGFVRVASVGALGVCLLLAAFLFERLVLRGTGREASS